ncbi:MAG: hydantoinase/oxoprolinase family protein, partial [Thermomicrobiales bacterium]
FDDVHLARYGHSMNSDRESVTFRLRAFGQMQKLRIDELPVGTGDPSVAIKSTRDIYMAGAMHSSHIYDRAQLLAGDQIDGPAIVEEASHISVIFPNDTLLVDRFGNLIITIGE